MIRQILQSNQSRGQKQLQLFNALIQLERTLPLLSSDDSLHKKAETLRNGILTRGFGVPKNEIEQFPVLLPRQDWRHRRVQVFQFLQKHGKLDDSFVGQMRRGPRRPNKPAEDVRKMRDRPGRRGQPGKPAAGDDRKPAGNGK